MNEIKHKLQEKVNHLKEGKPLIYEHRGEKESRRYLIMSGEKIHDDAFDYFIRKSRNLSILASDEFLRKKNQNQYRFKEVTPVNCEFSLKGIKTLLKNLYNGKDPVGPDTLVLKAMQSENILNDDSAEARILEFMSNVDTADGVLLYGLLLDESLEQTSDIMLIETSEIIRSRFFNPNLLEFTGVIDIDLLQGQFKLHSFYSEIDRRYHWAFVKDDGDTSKTPLVRIESECLTGHVFGSLLCDCGDQLAQGLKQVAEYGRGSLVYLRQEGRGIGLKAKLEAYYLQQVHGMDTVDANIAVGMPEDARDYVIGAQILNHLGFHKIKLMTNNPAKISGITQYGVAVEEQVAHIIPPHEHNKKYLETKKTRMGHKI